MANKKVTVEIGGDSSGAERAIQQSVDSLEKLRGELRKPQGKIEAVEQATRELGAMQTALDEARRKLSYFREQAKLGGDIGAKAFAADIRSAEREIDKLNLGIAKQSATVNRLSGDLKAAGVDTGNLASEKARLAASADRADKAIIQLKGQLLAERDAARDAALKTNEVGRAAGNAASGADRFAAGLKGVAAGIAAIGVKNMVTDLAQTAEAYNNITGRLRVAAGEGENLTKALELVSQAANASGSSLDATATLYTRLYQSTRELGLSQQQVADLTETINKSFRVSGASSAEAEGAIRQLAQALASGVLRGDEFNSVMEQSPRLSQALADGLGVPIGALREMAKEGKLTADVIIKALRDQSEAIQNDYSKLPETIGQAMQKLDNAWTEFIGKLNQSSGVTEAVAKAIGAVAENLDEIAEKAAYAGEVVLAALAIKAVGAVRAYIAEMALATTATGALAAATTALSVAWAKIGPAMRLLGWAAVAVEVIELTRALVDLRNEQAKHEQLSKNVADAQDKVRLKLAEISKQTGVTVTSMAELNQAVEEDRIHFNEATDQWEAGAAVLREVQAQSEKTVYTFGKLAEVHRVVADSVQASSAVLRAEAGLQAAQIGLAIEQQKRLHDIARAKGDTTAAIAAKNRIVELEIKLAEIQSQLAIAEAENAVKIAKAKSLEAQARGGNVEVAMAEIRVAELGLEAARTNSKIVAENVKRMRELLAAADGLKTVVGAVGDAMSRLPADLNGGIGDVTQSIRQWFADIQAIGDGMTFHVNAVRKEFEALGPAAAGTFETLLSGARDVFGPGGLLTVGPASPLARMREQMGELEDATASWVARLSSSEASLTDVERAMEFLNASTISGYTNMEALGRERLEPLLSALDQARRRLDDIRDSAADTLSSLRDELDEMNANYDDIERRRAQQREDDLQAQLAAARASGDRKAIADLEESLRLLRQINAERVKEAETREREEKTASGSRTGGTSTAPSGTTTTHRVTIALPSGEGTVGMASKADADNLAAILGRLQSDMMRAH